MTSYKKEKTEELLHHLAAEFLEKEAGPQSLITVYGVKYNKEKNKALILVSILPEEREKAAMDFVSRKKRELIDYLKEHSKIRTIPYISFELAPKLN